MGLLNPDVEKHSRYNGPGNFALRPKMKGGLATNGVLRSWVCKAAKKIGAFTLLFGLQGGHFFRFFWTVCQHPGAAQAKAPVSADEGFFGCIFRPRPRLARTKAFGGGIFRPRPRLAQTKAFLGVFSARSAGKLFPGVCFQEICHVQVTFFDFFGPLFLLSPNKKYFFCSHAGCRKSDVVPRIIQPPEWYTPLEANR